MLGVYFYDISLCCFGGVFVLSRCCLDFAVGLGAFVIGLSQISSFASSYCASFVMCRFFEQAKHGL